MLHIFCISFIILCLIKVCKKLKKINFKIFKILCKKIYVKNMLKNMFHILLFYIQSFVTYNLL